MKPRFLVSTCLIALFGIAACGDDAVVEPDVDSTLTVNPARQWAGGDVTLQGEALDIAGAVVFLDGEPAVVAPGGAGSATLTLPDPWQTGSATIEVRVGGSQIAMGTVDIVGFAWPARTIECETGACSLPRLQSSSPLSYHGVGLGPGRFLAFFETLGAGSVAAVAAVANLDAPVPVISWIPQLTAATLPGLTAPGPTPTAGRWILDASPPDTAAQAEVWSVGGSTTMVGPLSCLGAGMTGGYAVAELPTGDCLVITHASPGEPGALSVNGTSNISGYGLVPWGWTAGCVEFRGSPGHERITLRSLTGSFLCEGAPQEDLPAWPVFSGDGSLAFSNSRYPAWPRGVGFSTAGDTLWTVGESTGWTLDAWDAATGTLLAETALTGFERCEDLVVDALRPRVYLACRPTGDPEGAWPSLVVYDRQAEEIIAVTGTDPGVGLPALPPFELVLGGSTGRIHLVAVYDGTSAPADRGVLVASFDTF